MSYGGYRRPDGNGDLGSWIVTLILLVSPLWFVGLWGPAPAPRESVPRRRGRRAGDWASARPRP